MITRLDALIDALIFEPVKLDALFDRETENKRGTGKMKRMEKVSLQRQSKPSIVR